MLRLLCITAHPDDEAGGFGGSLLKYRKKGVGTHVLCLTAGLAATHRGGAKNDAELGAIRRKEFAAACGILEVSHAEVLDYPDGALEKQNFLAITRNLTRRIRKIRPQVMLTFGTEGGVTAHLDHAMTSHLATAAFHWAGRSNRFTDQFDSGLEPHRTQKLYYASASFTMPERQPIALSPYNAIVDIQEYLQQKIAAFHAHASQSPLFPFFDETIRRRGWQELFHLAAATRPCEMVKETDLFRGIEDIGD